MKQSRVRCQLCDDVRWVAREHEFEHWWVPCEMCNTDATERPGPSVKKAVIETTPDDVKDAIIDRFAEDHAVLERESGAVSLSRIEWIAIESFVDWLADNNQLK